MTQLRADSSMSCLGERALGAAVLAWGRVTPEDLRQKLADVDAQVADALRKLGLREDEIASIVDPRLPPEERKRRTDEALARAVGAQMSDPESPLFRAALARAASDIEANMPAIVARLEAEKRAQRKRRVLVGAALAVALLGAAAYFLLRPANPCVAVLGPLSELESVTKLSLVVEKPIGPYGRSQQCSITVVEKDRFQPGHIGNPIVILDRSPSHGAFAYTRKRLAEERFASNAPLDIGDESWLFVAGDEPAPSPEALLEAAKKNVRPRGQRGLGYDPMGAALAALPPAHHVVLARRGTSQVEIKFEQRAFTPDGAKAAAAKIVGRLK
ncbi:MAG: hypothetical protein JWP87_3955 [Labilithrix sp.]|nr:hypothetical protein [Labilithrix sp.]